MTTRDTLSSHWTDDQLIAYLYGVWTKDMRDPENPHVSDCEECRRRLEAMRAARTSLEREEGVETNLHADLLAMERRSIYARIDGTAGRISSFRLRPWAVSACGFVVVSIGAWLWEHSADLNQRRSFELRVRVSDEQLVEEASEVAGRAEPKAAAPLQALFEN